MAERKILIIDDEIQLTHLLKLNLERTGDFTVEIANNGDEGLALVHKTDPDVIILDVEMAGINGFEVLKALRKPDIKWYPVIMLTARSASEDAKKGYQLEADHYITKPFKTEDIIRGINAILSFMSAPEKDSGEDVSE